MINLSKQQLPLFWQDLVGLKFKLWKGMEKEIEGGGVEFTYFIFNRYIVVYNCSNISFL